MAIATSSPRAHHQPPTDILATSTLSLSMEDISSSRLHPPMGINNTSSTNSRTAGTAPVLRGDMVAILSRKGNKAEAGIPALIMGTPRREAMHKAPGVSIGGRTMIKICFPSSYS
mmetsp:Transcript_18448/g.52917  ORF Transcript_18448/g.52917 Transcript_18448/m.52917 type:complete len:115 (+) Transcript_18448:828-1172(+)